MQKINKKFNEIRSFCQQNANPEIEKKYSRYFTEGYDAYGIDRKLFESQRDLWLEQWKPEFTLNDFLDLGDQLIATGKYEEASFAVSFIYCQKEDFSAGTFDRLGAWLENGIVNWGHTDVLSGQAISYFFQQDILPIETLSPWTESLVKWKRRAVPVTLIEVLIKDLPLQRILAVIESLRLDQDKFVQKGLGWFLREAWKLHRAETETFLLRWKDTCGRTIIQYATEKMDKENKNRFKKPASVKQSS